MSIEIVFRHLFRNFISMEFFSKITDKEKHTTNKTKKQMVEYVSI